MKIQKFSFNVHGNFLKDEAHILTWVIENKPTTIVVLDNPKLASKIADLGVPYVVLRITKYHDDNLQLRLRSAAEWWNAVKHNYEDKRLGVYFINEPHTRLDLVSQYSTELMDILASEGRWGVFYNASVGTPELEQWQTTLKPMMQYLTGKYRGKMFLGLHEGYMYEPAYAVPYLSGRYRFLFDMFGRDSIGIIFTEFGVDYIPDVHQRYPGENIRGYKQHYRYWKDRGIENPTEYMLNHFKWLQDELYHDPEVLGICLYCFGDSGGWDLYDFEDEPDFLRDMDKLEMENVITIPMPVLIKSNSDVGTNRRTGAGTNFSKSKTLLMSTAMKVSELARQGEWIKYRFEDGDFWVHQDFITIVDEGKDVTITLYDASETEIEEVTNLLPFVQRFADLLKKLNAEIV